MYKLQDHGVLRLTDNAFIPNSPGNKDWQEYQDWLAAGNTPEPRFTPEEQAVHDRQQAIQAERQRIREVIRTAGPPPSSVVGLADRLLKLEIAVGLREPEI